MKQSKLEKIGERNLAARSKPQKPLKTSKVFYVHYESQGGGFLAFVWVTTPTRANKLPNLNDYFRDNYSDRSNVQKRGITCPHFISYKLQPGARLIELPSQIKSNKM